MKVAKPIIFHVPALFVSELDKHLKKTPPKFEYQIAYFYFIINFLTTQHYTKDKDKEFSQINVQNLRKLSICRIDKYIKYMKKCELLETDKDYKTGVKSLGYRLPEKLLAGEHYEKLQPGTKLFKKIIHRQRLNRSHYSKMPEHLKQMKELFMSVEIDTIAAKRWINENSTEVEKHFRRTMVLQFQDKRFRYFKRNSTNGRLDTNLTNIKKELRYCLKGDWTSFDLKNSQPFFFSQIVKSNLTNNNNNNKENATHTLCMTFPSLDPSVFFGISTLPMISKIRKKCNFAKNANLSIELNEFEKAVLSGKFYEIFMSDGMTRDEAKTMILTVFFSRNVVQTKFGYYKPYEKDKKKFANLFPFLYQIIEILKLKDHSKLAIYLQKIESFVFIDIIAKKLVEAGIVPLTIHDSILVPTNQKTEAERIIKNTFKELFGLIPVSHIESYNELRTTLTKAS